MIPGNVKEVLSEVERILPGMFLRMIRSPFRVSRLLAIALALAVFPAGAVSTVRAAGLAGPADLPAEISPEQAEEARKLLRNDAEARKAFEEFRKRKEETAREAEEKEAEAKKAEGKEAEEARQAPSAGADIPRSTPPYDWRSSTYVGSLFLKRLGEAESRSLSHFGHEIFNPTPGAARILENMPVGPGYVVGPGDEVVVRLWGRVEGTHRMTVDRDGKIYFPKFGSLPVAGRTFEEMKSFLKAKVATIAEVSSDVTLGRMKGIRVSVVGEVREPGWYNVSSLHTALQVLSLAGGIRDIGSLRAIRINRGGSEAGEIDLYDLLLKGDARSDVRLLQGDTVFVPVVGTLVAVVGEVRRPAIYELRAEKTLLDLVGIAGGFSPSAFKRRVQVDRLEGHDSKVVLDADASELEKEKREFALSDGDIVRVLAIAGPERNAVTVEGNVLRPGKHGIRPGMTVGALFRDERDFLPDTYFDYALLTRQNPPEMRKETVPVNLRRIVLERKEEADIPLRPFDVLTVFPRSAFRDAPKVKVSGEVRHGGTFDLKKGARVSDLVKLAGDLTRTAYLPQAEIVRIDAKRNFRTLYFDLGKAMSGEEAHDLLLEDEDEVRIHSIWETKYRKTVAVSGEVNAPGDYTLTEGMTLSDLLFKAGGLKESAYGREAELVRREVAPGGELVRTQTLAVSPERAVPGDAKFDVPLKEYDLLVVRAIPEWGEKIRIAVEGEVRFPGTYAARKGERLSSLVARAGGFTAAAYLKAAQFTRVSTRKSQQEAIDKLISDLELEVAQKAQEVTGVLEKEDVEANRQLMAARNSLVNQLKKARAKGRVIIRLMDPDRLKGSSADILLEDGDRLEVPRKTNVVNVVGRVYNPTGVVYDPANERLGHYLKMVGGPTGSADREHIFLVKADGSVVTRDSVESGASLFGGQGFEGTKVEPGDSIVVPEKLLQTRLMKDVKDITQILYQIAVTAGVLIVVF